MTKFYHYERAWTKGKHQFWNKGGGGGVITEKVKKTKIFKDFKLSELNNFLRGREVS